MGIPLTVALTTYNRSRYLRESLSAILDQTYRDFELLVLDNGSTDDTPYVVLGFNDDRIRYVRNPPGYTSSFNSISAQWIARSERVLITHDDDIMEPDMLEQMMALIALRPDLTAIWVNKSIIDEHGSIVHPWITPPGPTRIFECGEYIARAAEERLWYPASGMIFKPHLLSTATLLKSYRGVSEEAAKSMRARPASLGGGDHIRTALMNLKGPVAFLNLPLLRYRQHTTQETHHIHLAHAALVTFRSLRRLVRKTAYRKDYEPIFDSQIARFKVQDLILAIEQPSLDSRLLMRLARLLDESADRIAVNQVAGQPMLPLVLLLSQVGMAGKAYRVLDAIRPPDINAQTAFRSLYRWGKYRETGGNIFSSFMPGSNIVIHGSVLVAALLVYEAREAGVNILCCIDSNLSRQGRTWIGVPIVSPSWLISHDQQIDFIILSSERDHEEKLEEFIRRYDEVTPILSWKELVERASLVLRESGGEAAR